MATTPLWTEEHHSQLPQALNELPIAELHDIITQKGTGPTTRQPDRKAIIIQKTLTGVVSNHYTITQHKDAFKHYLNLLTTLNINEFTYSIIHNNPDTTTLHLYLGTLHNGQRYGIRIISTIDGNTDTHLDHRHITLYDPLRHEASILPAPTPITTNFLTIMHEQLPNILQKIITDAQNTILDNDHAITLLRKHIGPRMTQTTYNQYHDNKGTTLYDLYSAVNHIANHAILSITTRNTLLHKASQLLHERHQT